MDAAERRKSRRAIRVNDLLSGSTIVAMCKDKTVGKDKTNRRGKYVIKERNPDGTYRIALGERVAAGRWQVGPV